MPKEKPLYTYAIKRPDEGGYAIVHNNPIGIPVFESVAEAESNSRMYPGISHLKHVVINISSLVEAGIIPRERLFGKAIRKSS